MRTHHIVAVLCIVGTAGCHLILGLEKASLYCLSDEIICLCATATDCGPEPPECRIWKCEAAVCKLRNAPTGARCSKGVCRDVNDAQLFPPTTCVECNTDEDCGQGNFCSQERCRALPDCNNGIEDGDEGGVDCGGHCPECLGFPCLGDEACLSGHCIDGRCCNSACNGVCERCDINGECQVIPQFQDDNEPPCDGEMTCNGGGGCALRPKEPCPDDVSCASLKCENGTCTGPQ
jgi:hypothetical protein